MRKLLVAFALLLAPFAMPHAASAACATSMGYVFTNGSSALDATSTNANNNQLLACARNVDHSQVGSAGIYANQIIPTNGTQATFGSSQAYTFPAGVTAGSVTTAGAVSAATVSASGTITGSTITGTTLSSSGGVSAANMSATTTVTAGTNFLAGTSGTPNQSGLLWGSSAGGFTTGGIGASNSLAVNGVTGNNAVITANPGYGTLAIDYNGNVGTRGAVSAAGAITAGGALTGTSITGTSLTVNGATALNNTVTGTGAWSTSGNITSTGGAAHGLSLISDTSLAVGTTSTFGGTIAANGNTDWLHSYSQGCGSINWNSQNTGGTSVGGVPSTGFGAFCNNSSTPIFNVDSSGNGSFAQGVYAVGIVKAGSYVEATMPSGAIGATTPAFLSNGSTTSAFHTVLLSGATGSSCAGSPQGGSNCYSVTLPANLAFTSLGSFSCDVTNEVDNNGSNYQNIRSNSSPTTYDGRTFYITGGAAGQQVSSVCSGY